MKSKSIGRWVAFAFVSWIAAGCSETGSGGSVAVTAESCMVCHNGASEDNYAGAGLENPHPFGDASMLRCTQCHGGNPDGVDKVTSHVPPPPEIGDKQNLLVDRKAYFNRLTLAGLDKFEDYDVGGVTYTAQDYLQFINPGDLRVVKDARGCGACHDAHSDTMQSSLLATETGIFSGATFAAGMENYLPASQDLHGDTAGDLSFRAVSAGLPDLNQMGSVPQLLETPTFAKFGANGASDVFNNPAYDEGNLPAGLTADNRAIVGSALANLYIEQVSTTCGDCHLGSAGANNRYGDFRSSGCTACHMRYSQSGRSGSKDPNINHQEPLNVDAITAPERAHVATHKIRSVARKNPNGTTFNGIDDYTCAGCHQGSNRTVMQYWGIRLDQNADVANHRQYPANPVTFQTTFNDTRLFNPTIQNQTFNGRKHNQYLRFEDYDGDGRDDTPPDVHYDAGMGCIDCHGSSELHGGDVTDPANKQILSRMEQAVAIRCESCHGTAEQYAQTQVGTAWDGSTAELAVDRKGHVLKHVVKEADGHVYLYSKLTGAKHFVRQTLDTVVDNGKTDPLTGAPVYSAMASYAMGRADGNPATGIGPLQTSGTTSGFSHGDSMSCESCHSSWTNTCMGCHLTGEYNTNNNLFSNITGERSVFKQATADFTYQSPVFFQLGINADNRVAQMAANTKVFFQWEDRNNQLSQKFAFTDRNGFGNNPATQYPSLSHNVMLAHSIRGKVATTKEGPRYCVACHLTTEGLSNWGTQYDDMRTALAGGNYAALDFNLLRDHIGRNPSNQINSPLWVHAVAGLGSGLFLFNADGGPENTLDNFAGRVGANGVAPALDFDINDIALDLDRIVTPGGVERGSSNHMLLQPGVGPNLRDGSSNPDFTGPMGATLIERLTDPNTGIVLDSWVDANGQTHGDAATYIGGP